MATITPSVIDSPPETMTSKGGYLRLTITSISDSDAATNKRYISCKLTIEGTRWVGLYRWASTLGGQTVSSETRTVENWYPGHVLGTKDLTFDNDSSGNLSLTAYIKHIFFKGSGSWNTSYAKSITETCVCSQLPRYANFTSHSATSTLNTITVSYAADANYTGQQYTIDNGAHWNNCNAGSYTISNLTPNTSYTIKTRIYRADSGLETISSAITIKTKTLPTSNTPSNTNFNSSGTSVTGSISSIDYLSGWYIIVKDGNNEIINGSNSKSTSTSKSWSCSSSAATSMLNRHGSNNSWSLSVEYYVVSNGTTYQLTTRTCTCTLPSGTYLPTFTSSNLSYEVTNSTSNNVTGSNQKVIKGISNVRVKYTAASPQGGASISSYLSTCGTKSGSTNASTLYKDLTAVDASSFTVQATDTRSRSTAASKNYTTYIDYFAPYTDGGGINIARVDGVGANIRISISGKYTNWSGLSTTNTITQVSVKYKLKSASSYTNISITLSITASSGNFTATGTTTGDLFDIGNEYNVQVILKDVFNNLPINVSIPTGTVLMWKDLANNRIGIGKKPECTLDIDGIFGVSKYIKSTSFENIESKNIIGGWYRGYINIDTGADVADTTAFRTDYIPVDFSKNPSYRGSGFPSSSYRNFIAAYNANKQFLGRTGGVIGANRSINATIFTSGTPQGTGDIKYIRVTVYNGVPENSLSTIQIEKGTGSTTFVPSRFYGYIFGNNDNGSYIKFDDGTLICTYKQEISGNQTNFTTAYGSIYITSSSGQPSWTYPYAFVDVPSYISATLQTTGIGGAVLMGGSNAPTRLYAKCWSWNATSWSGATLYIYWVAIGRWK